MSSTFDMQLPHLRQALEHWPDAPTLANHYQAVVDSYESNQHGLIETMKSFIECVCLTILGDYGKPMPSASPSSTEMLVEALKVLGLHNTRGASRLDRILSAYNKLSDTLGDMRNENGPIAHGKDGFLDNLTQNHIKPYLFIADTILALLLGVLEGTEPNLKFTREPYERFCNSHEKIDCSVSVESSVEYEDDLPMLLVKLKTGNLADGIELRIEPSRLLYTIDREAYIALLEASFSSVISESESDEKDTAKEPVMPTAKTKEPIPFFEVVQIYGGHLLPLKNEFKVYMSSLGLLNSSGESGGPSLIDSILKTAEMNMGTDWREREVLQASMKIAFRRTLARFNIIGDCAGEYAEHLVKWFKIQSIGIA